ncbi:hypothetical protein PspLS_11937 [Pyricularia sp. CBS 133598]|nr:hypothetical protein PspLS_11937 [Pyricularia sp. CBS 133598]
MSQQPGSLSPEPFTGSATQTAIVVINGSAPAIQSTAIARLPHDQVLLRTEAVGINPSDTKMRGAFATPGGILGADYAGTVVAVGPGVEADVKVGDRVCGGQNEMFADTPDRGAFAQYNVTRGRIWMKVPDAMSTEAAAALGVGISTAGLALKHLGIPLPSAGPGDPAAVTGSRGPPIVLVYGASTSTATYAMQLMRLSGYLPIALCSPHNFQLARTNGAAEVFDYRDPDCSKKIRQLTKGGLELALDCITTVESTTFCFGAIGRAGGTYVSLDPFAGHAATRAVVRTAWVHGPSIFGEGSYWPGVYARPISDELRRYGEDLWRLASSLFKQGRLRHHPLRVFEGGFERVLEGMDLVRQGKIGGKEGHFMKANIKAFDAPFFAMTPAEAASLDPQQRMLLECVYTAMENAGYTMTDMHNAPFGVYVGSFMLDFRNLLIKDVDVPMTYTATGTISSTLAGRVSWFYGLRGPAVSVDTACSSSMVALHQAVIGLKQKDCNIAIACGTNVILTPEMGLEMNGLGVLDPAGASRSFDKSGNGYGRGEGISVVILKRLSDAIADGDTIRAVIRNTGCNHDGHSPGLTAPAKEAQVELMRLTYAQAKLGPTETRFFEAHGTGTNVGDPIEASAIAEIFAKTRTPDEPLYVGALKSNIGHTEGNSGIASFIKGVLCLESGIIPANAWFNEKNPRIKEEWNLHFPTKSIPWPKTPAGVRRVSINSFGISGTNAHVIMDDALSYLRANSIDAPHHTVEIPRLASQAPLPQSIINGARFQPQLFVLSSQDQDGIARLCNAYQKYLPTMTEPLYNLSYTLAEKRSKFDWRASVVASSSVELEEALKQGLLATRSVNKPGLGLVFTGQGAQWAKMGTGLTKFDVYRQSLEAASAYLRTIGCEWSAIDELYKPAEDSLVNKAEFSQTLCTVLQVALVDLFNDWGLQFRAVVGHSSGETAAAYSAGAISKESAWRIAFWRGKLSAKLSDVPEQPKGTMAAVGLTFEKAKEYIDKVHNSGFQGVQKLAVGCMNSQNSQTISGDVAQIDALVELLNNEGVFARKLKVEMAYHSHLMNPIAKEYALSIGEIEPGSATKQSSPVEFFSSAYGCHVEHEKLRQAAYWTTNLTSPVRFNESVTAMLEAKIDEESPRDLVTDLLEIGPHAALQGPLRNINDATRPNTGVKYHHALKRGEDDVIAILSAAGSLFTRGLELSLRKTNHVENITPFLMVDLPRYQFQHNKEYWYECRLSRNFRFRPFPRHELFGKPVNDWNGKYDAIWHNWIRLSENPWVEDHNIDGSVLYPAAGMLVMAIEGCKQLAQRDNPERKLKGFRFREVSFHSALNVPVGAMGVESHLYLRPVKQAALESKPSAWREFQVCTAQDDDSFREHCCGQVLIEYEEALSAVDGGREEQAFKDHCQIRIQDAKARCKMQGTSKDIYDAWGAVGLTFGPTFQTVSDFRVDYAAGITLAHVKPTIPLLKSLMPHNYLQPHLIHPTTLDGAIQACLVPLVSNPTRKQQNPIVVSFIEELWVSAADHSEHGYQVFADSASHGRNKHLMSCTAVDPASGEPMIKIWGCIVTEVDGNDKDAAAQDLRQKAWNIDYRPDPSLLSPEAAKKVFAGSDGFLKYVDALAHKDGSLKVLNVSNGFSATSKNVLARLEGRYSQYDITVSDSSLMKELQAAFSEYEGVNFKIFDVKADPSSQGLKTASYHLLLVPIESVPNTKIDCVVSRFLFLLKPGGKIIVTGARGAAVAETWGTCLTRNGFTVDAELSDGEACAVVGSAPAQEIKETLSGSWYVVGDLTSDLQRTVAEKVAASLLESGFTTKTATVSEYTQLTAASGEEEVSKSTCIVLSELESPLLTTADAHSLAAVKTMVTGKQLLWVGKDDFPDTAIITGFAAAIRLEQPNLALVTLAFKSLETPAAVADKILSVSARIISDKKTNETAYKVVNGVLEIPRLTEATAVNRHIFQAPSTLTVPTPFTTSPKPLRLQIKQIGLLSSLRFTYDAIYTTPLNDLEVEFKMMATAVNFKDLAVMLGKIQPTPFGLEAAGIVTRVGAGVTRFKPGDKVFGFTFNGAFSTHGRGTEGTLAHVPEDMSFAECSIIPIVYTTAYACMYDVGDLEKRLRRGQKPTILIHAATGGVGQAAIQLAQRAGVEIFATVGSVEKRDFLHNTYGVPHDHIFSSRDLTFKDGVRRMTADRGVDIVINSLAGDTLRATWELVAPFGAFAEIGLSDIESRSRISMGTFARGVRLEALELNYMRKTDPGRLDDLFSRAMESVLGEKLPRAMPITKYPMSKIQDAMRFMQSGKHIGKITVEAVDGDVVQVSDTGLSETNFKENATYVVSGGFGGLGIEIIRWMVARGARNLVVLSRSGPVDESARALVQEVHASGANILTPCCDITDVKGLGEALSKALEGLPSVKGCIQASTVLRDNVFTSMTAEEWCAALHVKATGSQNLWTTLTANSNNLDFFTMLSSLTGIIGNNGQSNYSAGNAWQDAFARQLSSQGHNVVALNAPVISDAGMVAERPALKEYLLSIGWAHMSTAELIRALDYHCRPVESRTAKESQVIPMLWLPKYSADEGAEQPGWQHEPMFNHLNLQDGHSNASAPGKQNCGKRTIADLIAGADTVEDAEKIVLDALLEQLSKILQREVTDLDPARPMSVFGVDSLVAVELRVWINKQVGADVSVFDMTSGQRISQLAAKAAATSRFSTVKAVQKPMRGCK